MNQIRIFCKCIIKCHKSYDWPVKINNQGYLKSDGEPNEVDDHFLVGQLDSQNGQGSKEQLKVFMDVILFFTAQIDMAVKLLAMLQTKEARIRKSS